VGKEYWQRDLSGILPNVQNIYSSDQPGKLPEIKLSAILG
jgi:hypothetical protein